MAWNTFGTHSAGTPLTPAEGDKIAANVKQLAADLYISPASGDDGLPDLAYPLQTTSPVLTSHTTGEGTAGKTVALPAGYTPASGDDYEVLLSWQENPGSNGALWAEKTASDFVIKHYGSETGKKIAYQIVRKTA